MQYIKIFWLTNRYIDKHLHSTGRIEIIKSLVKLGMSVKSVFFYCDKKKNINNIKNAYYLKAYLGNELNRVIVGLKELGIFFLKSKDDDFLILGPVRPELFYIFHLLAKLKSKPKLILDIRTVPVDVPKGVRGIIREKTFHYSIKLASRYFAGIMVISRPLKEKLIREYKIPEKKICIYESGVNLDLFNFEATENYRNKLNFTNRFVIMYHGIFSPNRGLQNVIKAIARLKDEYPEILFFLLGKGPAENEFKEMVKNMALDRYVLIHPPVPQSEVPKYIKSADIGILPFPDIEWWRVSSPLKLMEYLAMKKPVIVTNIPAHRNVIGNKKCGIFIPNHQPEAIIQGIKSAIENRKKLADWGEEGLNIILNNYTWDHQALKIVNFLNTLKQ